MSFLEDAAMKLRTFTLTSIASIPQLPCQYEFSLGFPVSYKVARRRSHLHDLTSILNTHHTLAAMAPKHSTILLHPLCRNQYLLVAAEF